MGLTSGPFVILLIVLAVATAGACVWFLPHVKGPSPQLLLARFGMIAFTQALVLFAVLVAINSSFVFYSSWGDLLGDNSKAPVRVHDRGGRPASPSGLTATHDGSLPVLAAGTGKLQAVLIHGQRTGINAPAYLYLPPQYLQAAYHGRRFPVVLVLASTPGAARGLVTQGKLPQTAAQQISAGKIQPTIYLVTDLQSTGGPGGAGCVDVPGGRQAETFLTQDVPTAAGASYRVASSPDGWGVFGSDTAYCAAKIALRRSDQFSAATFPAGSYSAPAGDFYGKSTQIRNENDLLWRLNNRPPPPVDLLVLNGGRPAAPGLPAARLPLQIQASSAAATNLPIVMEWFNARLTPGP